LTHIAKTRSTPEMLSAAYQNGPSLTFSPKNAESHFPSLPPRKSVGRRRSSVPRPTRGSAFATKQPDKHEERTIYKCKCIRLTTNVFIYTTAPGMHLSIYLSPHSDILYLLQFAINNVYRSSH